ncbi:MAG: CheB methylesterase domain-containing protein [Polyangiales bacterium]
MDELRAALRDKVRLIRQISPVNLERSANSIIPIPTSATPALDTIARPIAHFALVIGASTGASALVRLFQRFPAASDCAIVVAQHMPQKFTTTFAERLNRLNGFLVKEADNFEILKQGCAYICPGGQCVELLSSASGFAIRTTEPAPSDRYVPSVDRLFSTAAQVLGDRVAGAILTGMGDDGANGAREIKASGGTIYVESAASAVVSGMPQSTINAVNVDGIFAIDDLCEVLVKYVKNSSASRKTV